VRYRAFHDDLGKGREDDAAPLLRIFIVNLGDGDVLAAQAAKKEKEAAKALAKAAKKKEKGKK